MEILLTYIKVFLVGGLICLIAQIIINYTKITAGKILVYFLLAGVFLRAVGLYQYLVEFAQAGATIPICGFGFLLADGAIKGAKISLFDVCSPACLNSLQSLTYLVTLWVFFTFIFHLKQE